MVMNGDSGNDEKRYNMEYYLMHYNPNHDPKTGQFAPSRGPKIKGFKINNDNKKEKQNYAETYLRQNIKAGKDKPQMSRAEITMKNVKDTVNALETTRSTLQKASERKQKGKSATGMSDTELRNAINRIQMERTYESLTKPETKAGYIKAQEILSIVGSAVTIGAAATAIASNIYTMKHPK